MDIVPETVCSESIQVNWKTLAAAPGVAIPSNRRRLGVAAIVPFDEREGANRTEMRIYVASSLLMAK